MASTTAMETSAAVASVPRAHSTETLLGTDMVTSMARTLRSRWPASQSSPVVGSWPSTSARRSSAATTPSRPSSEAQLPRHTPGASPMPM